MLFLHGILGRGANWRTIARRFVELRPTWTAVLVDLRLHGDSAQAEPPHTVAEAAADLDSLQIDLPIRGVLGHSFGGKVALQWDGADLQEKWLIDSNPSARPHGTRAKTIALVIKALRAVPREASSRAEFVAELEAQRVVKPLAQWLAMNLERTDEGFRYPLDLDAIEAMLVDYFSLDLWPLVDERCRIVIGTRSWVFDAESKELAAKSAAQVFPVQAGHWVHADAPDSLLSLLSTGEPPSA